jgi:type IX secretion system PorP/SprF family membrane protein
MKHYQKKLAGVINLLIMTSAFAQDIHFSQFYETPLYRNPAFAGVFTGDIRVQAVFRSQWNSFVDAYKTGSMNAEYKMPVGKGDDYFTTGFEAFYDQAGSANLTTTIFTPVLNYHKSISNEKNMYLSAAFMGGIVNRRFDRSRITTNNQYDVGTDGENFSRTQYSYWDGSAGISFNSGLGNNPQNNILLGVAYNHFNRPRNSFYEDANVLLDPKLVFSGDFRLGVNDNSWITFHSDYSIQGTYRELIGGMLYGIKIGPVLDDPDYTINGGAFLRWNDAIVPVIKIDYHPFSIAISYDVNISQLKTTSYGRGGAEMSVTYIGFLDRKNSSLNAVHCPRF